MANWTISQHSIGIDAKSRCGQLMSNDEELRVAEIWRYPVKSMGGERIDQADVGPRGIYGDRGWAVRDNKAGAIRSARYIPRLLLCSARYLPGTSAGLVPHVAITLPDGSTINSDDDRVHHRLSDAMGKDLTLMSLKPDDEIDHLRLGPEALVTGSMETEIRMLFGLTDNEPLPDMSQLPPALMRELSELGAPRGTYFDAFPIDILTTSSIRYLQRFLPDVNLEVRRFRPNFLVDDAGASDAIREREWIGRTIALGKASFDAVMESPRCTIIAAEQHGGIAKNSSITRTLVKEMRQLMSAYCTVATPGRVRVGDVAKMVT
ncbi:molybdenum cofactor biosysynthesis protein [Sphingomonas sp. DBB INV C78]|uniref:MOSC domain-containing protein n=1 Tax=Sphingomonas sp. DBB INV C78 TaxID=3349434 RepID=UPI0036D283BC